MAIHPAELLTAPRDGAATCVHLFAGPYLTVGPRRVDVPEGGKRLLALVCVAQGPVERRRAAGLLWPDGDDVRAAGNLRSALWRLRGGGVDVVASDKVSLWLTPGTSVDVAVVGEWADRVVAGRLRPGDLDAVRWHPDLFELLPGWYDDWAIFEREHQRQVVLHALEALARHLTASGRGAEAVSVALTAVAAEPLRESAQRVLIEAHLAEGNLVEARRAFAMYRSLALRELGVEPSRRLRALVSGVGVAGIGVPGVGVPAAAS